MSSRTGYVRLERRFKTHVRQWHMRVSFKRYASNRRKNTNQKSPSQKYSFSHVTNPTYEVADSERQLIADIAATPYSRLPSKSDFQDD
ncbi:hypothetical protein N7495_007927 [Penicillium taxi]|uniref:uncharacterized protein n=1 Tax=Penicillium taxi TaxID=168475 RepID=UPI00254501B2|nr:uncharacterized protein N7495_007927 [Penicillium taxi]KAJ5887886.1 hypothetical protein N7495_007927 [Penicillium taxi]